MSRTILCVFDKPFFRGEPLPGGRSSSHHVTAIDTEDYLEVVVGPLGRTLEFDDILGPDLFGASGQQSRLLILGTADLAAPLPNLKL
jgi:hypothetical protein